MAPKNLISRKRGNKLSDENCDSDSDGGAAEPKKPKLVMPLKRQGSEPVENGSACSSPSQKPQPRAEKKKKKKNGSASASNKVFSEDDVISLLKGLAVFWANGKKNKWAEFHLFVKDDIGNQFTKIQVSEKIRSLKKKFDAYSERAKANGGRIHLSDPHESAVFELSKALWGQEKVQMVVENGNEEESTQKEKEQVTENSSKGEEMEKSKEAEQGVEESREEGDAANTILGIRKPVDENGEGKKKARKKTKQGDGVDEKKELVMEDVTDTVDGNLVEEFQSAYPLLYASFNSSDYPKVAMDACVGIGRENAEELEDKLREIHIEMHRLELKKLHLISRHRQPK